MEKRIDCGSYMVNFGAFSAVLNKIVVDSSYSKIAVLTDSNTYKYCLPLFKNSVDFKFFEISIPAGEQHKTLHYCESIWEKMTEIEMDRKSLLINLGGGVIGDIGGFCASVFMRGIDFIHVPTSVLAQVDASIGGKVGIDFHNIKNYLGSFNFPESVLIDYSFLNTLPERHLKNGFAEIIKHALILDNNLWQQIQNIDKCTPEIISPLIYPSVALKQSVVVKDPNEIGLRKILNYGHSIGHALESYYLNSKKELLHGEAIAIGMVCEGFISYKRESISLEDLNQIIKVCQTHFEKKTIKEKDLDEIIRLVSHDKKNEGQRLFFTLLNGIGNCEYNQEVNTKDIKNSLLFYQSI